MADRHCVELSAPPSITLACMAWDMASRRAGFVDPRWPQPAHRSTVAYHDGLYQVSRNYYAIIDRISRGERP